MSNETGHNPHTMTYRIVIGMFLGAAFGLLIRFFPQVFSWLDFPAILKSGGEIFLTIIKMLVVPIVFVSIVCGAASLGDIRKVGLIGGKTIALYLFTTALAVVIALSVALAFGIGHGMDLGGAGQFSAENAPTLKSLIINLFPSNIFKAFHDGEMLQIIVFALLFGVAMAALGEKTKSLQKFFNTTNEVLMKLITMLMQIAPYGVFCLIGVLFSDVGWSVIAHLLGYFLVVLTVLFLQLLFTYTPMLYFLGRLNPIIFFKKMRSVMLFAFSVSSSNATIPFNLKNSEEKLGVKNSIASFVIPLGATINMDGSAMMQGVATVFIAHAYGVHLTFMNCITVVVMATIASIGAAGVPSVGLITLAMVLKQVGLPVEGISLIIGVDRLLDMARTAVNVCGDAMVACLIGKSEASLDAEVFERIE